MCRKAQFLCVGAVISASGAIAAPTMAQAPADHATTGIQEIVVTAQKRSENLQRVPVAVTALTPEILKANRFQNAEDLNALAPGLSARPGSGGAARPIFTMRGIYGLSITGQDQGVALYLDGVYINSSTGAAFDLADVERIEVLRGPQGTLFGRNSIGGAVNIITHNPTGVFGGHQELSYGNLGDFRSKTLIDLPALGPLSATFSYLHYQRRGDIRNLGAGTTWDYSTATSGKFGSLTSPKYLGDQNVNSVGATIKLDASTNLSFMYKFHWTENHFTGEGEGVAALDSANPASAQVLGLLAIQPDPSILTPISRTRPSAINNAFSVPGTLRTQDHNLITTFRVNDEITLKNILGYRKSYLFTAHELDGFGGLVVAGMPFALVGQAALQNEKQWSDEFQALIHTNWFTLTAGYLHFDVKTTGLAGTLSVLQNTIFPGHVIPYYGVPASNVKVTSDALYFQNEIHLTDKLDMLVGSRMSQDRKSGLDTSYVGHPAPFRYRDDQPTYLAGLNYRLSTNTLTYFKFSTGYISGGNIATIEFNPTIAKSYEVGIKADLFNKSARANIALFRADYSQLQYLTTGLNYGIPSGEVVFNGGDARAQGVEFEGTLIPLQGLTLNGSFSYTDFKYTKVNPLLGTVANFRPVFIPKWTSDVSAEYRTREILGSAYLTLRADANYTSSEYTTTGITESPEFVSQTSVPSTWIVNGRVALAGIDIGSKKAEIALWGTNLTNRKTLVGGSDFAIFSTAIYQRARSYGAELTFDF